MACGPGADGGGEQGPEAGVECRPELVVQLSGPAPPVVAVLWEEVGNPLLLSFRPIFIVTPHSGYG